MTSSSLQVPLHMRLNPSLPWVPPSGWPLHYLGDLRCKVGTINRRVLCDGCNTYYPRLQLQLCKANGRLEPPMMVFALAHMMVTHGVRFVCRPKSVEVHTIWI